jgi:hypothetical protein
MALTIGHRNLKTLGCYDRNVYLKHFAAQALLRQPYDEETGDLLDFDWHYNQQLALWNGKEIPSLKEHLLRLDNDSLPCMSLVAPVVPSDFYWPPIMGSANMPNLVAQTAIVKNIQRGGTFREGRNISDDLQNHLMDTLATSMDGAVARRSSTTSFVMSRNDGVPTTSHFEVPVAYGRESFRESSGRSMSEV